MAKFIRWLVCDNQNDEMHDFMLVFPHIRVRVSYYTDDQPPQPPRIDAFLVDEPRSLDPIHWISLGWPWMVTSEGDIVKGVSR